MQPDDLSENVDILLLDFKSGNTAALQILYDLHYRSLWSFAERLIRDPDQAEDIVAETFIKLWKRRKRFEQLENIRPFLFLVTRNACFTYLKQLKRKKLSHKEILYLSDFSDKEVNTEQVRAELAQQALFQAESMPPQMKKIFSMFYIEGKSLSEIARDLDISINTVRAQKVGALKRVREALFKKGLLTKCILFMMLIR